GHFKQMHAYTLMQLTRGRIEASALPLRVPLGGLFFCRHCRRRVPATIEIPCDGDGLQCAENSQRWLPGVRYTPSRNRWRKRHLTTTTLLPIGPWTRCRLLSGMGTKNGVASYRCAGDFRTAPIPCAQTPFMSAPKPSTKSR